MVVIRLARGGAKKRPFYNIVVSDSRERRDGRFIERVGFYNPMASGGEQPLRVAIDRVSYWSGVGAQLSPTVARLVDQAKDGRPDARRVTAASDPSAPDAEFPADAIEVARVLDAWGVKGWLRVQPYAKDPQALFSSRRWFLRPPEPNLARPTPMATGAVPLLLRIIEAREHGDDVVASVRDITDRNQAEALRGARIFVPRSSFPSAASDEFYWVDLIGLQVVNRDGVLLGEVSGLIDNGVHSVLRVRAASDAPAVERLIPFVAAYVDQVDLKARRIGVDWGLDY